MRPSLQCMAGHLLIRKYVIHNFMIEETVLYKNVDEYEAENTMTIRTSSKVPSLPHSRMFKLMKARLCESATICVKITQNSDTRAKLIAILDNTGQPALIQASRHACVKIRSMTIN